MSWKNTNPYPSEEKADKLEGKVVLTMVVGIDRRAHDIKVTKSLITGSGCQRGNQHQELVFQPGTKNGKPVAVRATIEVNFRLL